MRKNTAKEKNGPQFNSIYTCIIISSEMGEQNFRVDVYSDSSPGFKIACFIFQLDKRQNLFLRRNIFTPSPEEKAIHFLK